MQNLYQKHFLSQYYGLIFIICVLSSFYSVSYAAETPIARANSSIVGTVNPTRVGEFLSEPAQRTTAAAHTPRVEAPQETQPAIPGAEKIKLTLIKVIIEGSTVYSDAELQAIFKPYYHHEITLAKLLALVDTVTNKYRNDGYILSKAYLPPQQIKGGMVRINIIEGYVHHVQVTGKPQRVDPVVLAYGKQVQNKKPLKISELERYMLLMSDLPGTDVKAVLVPSKTQTGASDLDLITEYVPIQGSISYDNYNSRYLGPREVTLSLQANSFLKSGDMNLLRAVTSTQTREMKYLQFQHDSALLD